MAVVKHGLDVELTVAHFAHLSTVHISRTRKYSGLELAFVAVGQGTKLAVLCVLVGLVLLLAAIAVRVLVCTGLIVGFHQLEYGVIV